MSLDCVYTHEKPVEAKIGIIWEKGRSMDFIRKSYGTIQVHKRN